jgi:hypothetical protein
VLIDACHSLRHESGFSIPQIQQWLAEHGVPRSRGAVHKYLTQFPCDQCTERPNLGQVVAAT